MDFKELKNCLETNPVIAAVSNEAFDKALLSPVKIIFYLEANLMSIEQKIADAHKNDKCILIHLDLAEGLGRDKIAIEYLFNAGADGIITTRSQLVKMAKYVGLITVQRFFSLDSKGLSGIPDVISFAKPDLIEIMPGIATKVIKRFADGNIPVIAGGLIETKSEVTEALSGGAFAVSTGKEELWYL